MRILISPAKKMNRDTDSLPPTALPPFLAQAEQLLAALRALSPQQLQRLWKCNDALAKLNVERLGHMDLREGLTPAILAYEGIQYQYMAPGVMDRGQLAYLQEHVRILSGFYGVLRPFDGVAPYRLEMQAKLPVGGAKDLYAFWGKRLGEFLGGETGLVVDLASKEYSRAVRPHLPEGVRAVSCAFCERQGERLVEKGTLCKMARGQMVRWLAENRVERPSDIRGFSDLGYRFSPKDSRENELVFIRLTEQV